MSFSNQSNIKSWAEDDRPREKLILKGPSSLSDAELIAILIGSGVQNSSAVHLAKNILSLTNYNLQQLGRIHLSQLQQVKGIGEAKAVTILAALELGRRRQLADVSKEKSIKSSQQAYDIISPYLYDLNHEEFWIILLNRRNIVLSCKKISQGGMAGTVVDVRSVFKIALQEHASSIILAHNHPSGTLRPSQADIHITQSLVKAGKTLDIPVVDHLIITSTSYYSLAENGDMYMP